MVAIHLDEATVRLGSLEVVPFPGAIWARGGLLAHGWRQVLRDEHARVWRVVPEQAEPLGEPEQSDVVLGDELVAARVADPPVQGEPRPALMDAGGHLDAGHLAEVPPLGVRPVRVRRGEAVTLGPDEQQPVVDPDGRCGGVQPDLGHAEAERLRLGRDCRYRVPRPVRLEIGRGLEGLRQRPRCRDGLYRRAGLDEHELRCGVSGLDVERQLGLRGHAGAQLVAQRARELAHRQRLGRRAQEPLLRDPLGVERHDIGHHGPGVEQGDGRVVGAQLRQGGAHPFEGRSVRGHSPAQLALTGRVADPDGGASAFVLAVAAHDPPPRCTRRWPASGLLTSLSQRSSSRGEISMMPSARSLRA